MIGLHLDHFYVFWLEPLATDKTKEHMHIYYVGEESANGDELKELRKENARFWKDVMLEDISAIEGMQAGKRITRFIMVEIFHQQWINQLINFING
jgi:choline monooxygenase